MLESGYQGEGVIAKKIRHQFRFLGSDPVFSRDRATHRDAKPQNLFTRSLRPFQIDFPARVKRQNRMHVAVTGMKNVTDGNVVLAADIANCLKRLCDLRARNDAVLDVVRWAHPSDRSKGVLAALPEQVALFC